MSVPTFGADRVVEPPGALPQPAHRLDAAAPRRPHEIEIAVEALYLDSTSFRQIRESAGADPGRMAHRIERIVADRGKMQNPVTGSGGVLVGTCTGAGVAYPDAPVGRRVVSLVSLSQTPLAIEAAGPVDADAPRVPVTGGVAYLPCGAPLTVLPDDLPEDLAVAVLDVYGAASHVRDLAQPGQVALVLGAGHAGVLSIAAAREAVGSGGTVVAVDASAAACERVRALGLCDQVLEGDLQSPVAVAQALADAGVPPADLTVVVVNAERCELSAAVLTREGGSVLFFSMATSFTRAALGAEGIGRDVRMLIGSGYAADRGAYALDLVRASPELAGFFRPAA